MSGATVEETTEKETKKDAGRQQRPPVKFPVLVISAVAILAVAGWCLLAPTQAYEVLGAVTTWISEWFGWFYILLATVIVVFVIYLGVRFKRVRLGHDSDRPEYSTFAWASMLFAAGIGTDVMFYAVAEPAAQFLTPPQIQGETLEAARQATVWTLFHYGITGWGMYALMGMALGYFAHRKQLPLAVRSALYPIFGKRVQGPIGDAVDVATVLGTIFGVATSLGIGVVMLNAGIQILFGVPQGIPAQVGLTVLAVVTATISATTGVDRGIRILSQLNVLLAIALALWVLITGDTAFLLRAITMNVGDFVRMFPGMTLDTMAFQYPADWMSSWTLFFWAWWVAWASFVGMFLARISRGRTIGQFVVGTMTIPFSYIVMWVSIFGNSTIKRIQDGDKAFGELASGDHPEQGFFDLLMQYPGALVLVGLATFVGLLFYVTSADSGALVMANLSSHLPDAEVDARASLRIFWSAATGVLTIAMLVVGGIPALQQATVIMGLPFAVVMVLVMIGLWRALEGERATLEAERRSLTSQIVGREAPATAGSWRRRLSRSFGTVSLRQAEERLEKVVLPALEEVAAELVERGLPARVNTDEDHNEVRVARRAALVVVGEDGTPDFRYPVQVRRLPAPSYGARMIEADDMTTHLEVALPSGLSYDVYTYTTDQVCHDVLDHYERRARVAASTATAG